LRNRRFQELLRSQRAGKALKNLIKYFDKPT